MTKKLITILLLGLVISYVIIRFTTKGEELIQTLKQATPTLVALAFIVEGVYLILLTLLYQHSFKIHQLNTSIRHLFLLLLASNFITIAIPFGPLAGMGLFLNETKRLKISKITMTSIIVMVTVSQFTTLFLLNLLSLLYLYLQRELQPLMILGSLLLMVLIFSLGSIYTLARFHPQLLESLLGLIKPLLNYARGLKNSHSLEPQWQHSKVNQLNQLTNQLRLKPFNLLQLLTFSLLTHCTYLAILSILFLAFHSPISFVHVLAGYTTGMVFWIVSPTPQGLGFVESLMPQTFASLGENLTSATLVTLSFRGITLWFPALLGILSLHFIHHHKN